MNGYTTREVAELAGLSPDQVRRYIRRGLLEPGRGRRGEYRFDFPDLVLLRTARGLRDGQVPPRRAFAALLALKEKLGRTASLAALRIQAEGAHVVVRSEDALWDARSGQGHLDFTVRELAGDVADLRERRYAEDPEALDSDDFFNLGVDLEAVDPGRSVDAYRRAIELDSDNVDAYVNLGRLLQGDGLLEEAGTLYRQALALRPDHQLGLFNLGTLYDEFDDLESPVACYRQAADVADAHYNLCRIFEIRGDEVAALRHLRRYRQLMESS